MKFVDLKSSGQDSVRPSGSLGKEAVSICGGQTSVTEEERHCRAKTIVGHFMLPFLKEEHHV